MPDLTTNHAPEPWTYDCSTAAESFIKSVDGQVVVPFFSSYDDARRIVACVNACREMDTMALETEPVSLQRIIMQTQDECRRTIALISDLRPWLDNLDHKPECLGDMPREETDAETCTCGLDDLLTRILK